MKNLVSKIFCIFLLAGSSFSQVIFIDGNDLLSKPFNNSPHIFKSTESLPTVKVAGLAKGTSFRKQRYSTFGLEKQEWIWDKFSGLPVYQYLMGHKSTVTLNWGKSQSVVSITDAIKTVGSPKPLMWTNLKTYGNSGQGENMPHIPTRALIAGALFVPTILTGYLINHTDKPFNPILLGVHKIAALADLVLLNYTIYQKIQITSLSPLEVAATVVMNICFVGTMVTGALLSTDNHMPQMVHTAHSIGPWLTIASSGLLLYILGSGT